MGYVSFFLEWRLRSYEKCDENHTLFMAQWGISNRAITYILILLSGKILRTGFPVQQFHICASRVFFNINPHCRTL